MDQMNRRDMRDMPGHFLFCPGTNQPDGHGHTPKGCPVVRVSGCEWVKPANSIAQRSKPQCHEFSVFHGRRSRAPSINRTDAEW